MKITNVQKWNDELVQKGYVKIDKLNDCLWTIPGRNVL